MVDFEANKAILDRTAEILGFSGHGSKKKLAAHLGVSEAVVSGWRSRNQIDYDILREKLTDEQLLFALKGTKTPNSSFDSSRFVSKTEFYEEMLSVSKRIDRLEAAAGASSGRIG